MAIFAEMKENECVKEKHPRFKAIVQNCAIKLRNGAR